MLIILYTISTHLSVYLSICLSVYLSICLSVYLSICLSIYLSIYLFICSRCSRLERKASLKNLFHLTFLILDSRQDHLDGDQLVARPLTTHKHRINTRVLSEILTHDTTFRAGQNISCLRLRGYCDRFMGFDIYLFQIKMYWSKVNPNVGITLHNIK
jgi:hypothetical protein